MPRSLGRVLLLAAALLAPAAAYCDEGDIAYLRESVLAQDDPFAAANFLKDSERQRRVEQADARLYREIFARAAELQDMSGLLRGSADARSIRLGVRRRPDCRFCQDARKFVAWARRHLEYLDAEKFEAIELALWEWPRLAEGQRRWLEAGGLKERWPNMPFHERHESMRLWAQEEKAALLRLNPASREELEAYRGRAGAARDALGSHETTELWRRYDLASQAVASLLEARSRVGAAADPRLRALLEQVEGAADPEKRLLALGALFDNMGGRPRQLAAAAPARPDQKFDAPSRALIGSMLATALIKETDGTWAGEDLREFYARVPLRVSFSETSMNALGWYRPGTDQLHLNERYIEQYVKSRGASVEKLKSDPELLRDLARTLVGTFVHEAQHHRQDVWSRENKLPRAYQQWHEVEAFQVQALFLLQKLSSVPESYMNRTRNNLPGAKVHYNRAFAFGGS